MQDTIKNLENKLKKVSNKKEKVDILNKLAWELKYKDIKRSIELANQAYEIAKKISYKFGLAKGLQNQGTFFLLKSDFDKALTDLIQAGKIFEEIHAEIEIAANLNTLGLLYQNLGDNEKSLDYYLKSLQIKEKLGDEIEQATSLINIGSIYLVTKKFQISLKYSKKALELNRKIGNKQGEAMILGNIGYAYQELKEYNKALEYTNLSLKLFKDMGDKNHIAMSLGNMGVCYSGLKKYDAALTAYNKSLSILQEIGDKNELCATMNDIGLLYFKMNKCSESLQILNEALAIAKESNIKPKESNLSLALYEVYKKLGDAKIALKYHERHYNIEKEILSQQTENRINKLMIEFQVERAEKEAEIYRLKNIELNEKNVLITKQKKDLTRTLAELKKTQKQLIESEKMASLGTLIAGVAHEINTPVGVGITASSKLMEETDNINKMYLEKNMDRDDLKNYLQLSHDSNKLILNNLQRTADLIQSFKNVSVDQITENKRKFNLKSYLTDIMWSISPKFKEKNIQYEILCSNKLDINSYPGIFAQIITNLVLNSLIYGFANKDKGNLKISVKRKNNKLNIIFEDNGKGVDKKILPKIFDPFFTTNKQKGTGLGLHIVYNLVTQKLNGSIDCISEVNKKTMFKIDLPLT